MISGSTPKSPTLSRMSLSLRSLLVTALLSGLTASTGFAGTEPAPSVQPPIATGEVLNGQWRRPDGGYVIQIKAVGEGGQLEATYFNPRPIRVESAQWLFGGGVLQLRIRLNDTGYQGAFYLLQYEPTSNRLVGEYHPANQQTFPVAFERLLAPSPE